MHYGVSDRQQEVEVLVWLGALVHLSAGERHTEKLHLERQACRPLVQIAGLGYGAGALEFDVRLVGIEPEALEQLVYEAFEAGDGENDRDNCVGGIGDSPIARSQGDMKQRGAIERVGWHWRRGAAA